MQKNFNSACLSRCSAALPGAEFLSSCQAGISSAVQLQDQAHRRSQSCQETEDAASGRILLAAWVAGSCSCNPFALAGKMLDFPDSQPMLETGQKGQH